MRNHPPLQIELGQAPRSYVVRNEGEWSRIFLEEGVRSDGTRWGYISFVSTFGNRGHVFSHIGTRPFADFLTSCDWGYLANKFWGLEAQVFDFDKTIADLRRRICEARRSGMKKEDARECWDEIDSLEHSNSADWFAASIWFDCDKLHRFIDLGDHLVEKVPNPQCEGFRDHIWQPFCEHLRAELAPKVAA